MAHKLETTPPSSSAFTHISPTLSESDKLLSSILSLPPNPCIVYATYSPSGVASPCEVLESARRQLVSRNQTCSFQDSILPHVHIDRDASTFHAFVVASNEQVDSSLSTLKRLTLDDLIGEQTSIHRIMISNSTLLTYSSLRNFFLHSAWTLSMQFGMCGQSYPMFILSCTQESLIHLHCLPPPTEAAPTNLHSVY
jgi:hypothetical protein